jgi:hypothetical protein
MSIMSGVSQALGIRLGMALADQKEMRPILRKRLLANIVYVLTSVYSLGLSFTWLPVEKTAHIFVVWVVGHQGITRLATQIGVHVDHSFVFTWVMVLMSVLITAIVIFASREFGRKLTDLTWGGYAVLTFCYSFVTYALIYDSFYWLGNSCLPVANVLCFNFANYANNFASSAALVYLFRSTYVLTPLENGTIVFNGAPLVNLKGGGIYFIPTLPVPHFICVGLNYAFDMIPFLWDMYHHPDGREHAVQNHLRW